MICFRECVMCDTKEFVPFLGGIFLNKKKMGVGWEGVGVRSCSSLRFARGSGVEYWCVSCQMARNG
jgi:hypothetical protein